MGVSLAACWFVQACMTPNLTLRCNGSFTEPEAVLLMPGGATPSGEGPQSFGAWQCNWTPHQLTNSQHHWRSYALPVPEDSYRSPSSERHFWHHLRTAVHQVDHRPHVERALQCAALARVCNGTCQR